MIEISVSEYTKNYNMWLRESKKKYPKPTQDQYESVYKLAESYGLRVNRIGTIRIYTPEQYQKYIETGKPVTYECSLWESEYKVPKGNWLYEIEGTCGKGCLCVDRGVDKSSLDKINSLKSIEVGQVCDGSKEHEHHPRKTPLLGLTYISDKPLNINSLKLACKSAKEIQINDPKRSQRIENLCIDKKIKRQMIGNGASIIIEGKRYNDKQFWQDAERALSNIELNKPKRQIISKSKPKLIKTSYGEASVVREKPIKLKPKQRSSGFLGLSDYV